MAIRYLSGINVDSNTLFVDDANNRVGIGTASPARKLDVAGSVQLSYSDPVFTLYDTGALSFGTTNARIEFNNSYATVGYVEQTGEALRVASTGGFSSVSLFTNGSDRLFVSSSGNVGIGTTTPARKLVVAGDVTIQNKLYGTATDWTYYQISSSDWHHRFFTRTEVGASLERFTVEGGATTGNSYFQNTKVGIGTTTPKENLHIVGGTGSGTVSRLRIGGEGTGNNESTLQLVEHVQGDDMIYGYSFTADGNNTNNFLLKRHSNSVGGSVSLSVGRDTGYVGILTNNPSKELDVVGTLRIQGTNTYDITSDNDALQHTLNSAVRGFKFNNNNGNLLSITSAGNVGIGTTSPSQKLDVSGSIKATGNIFIGTAGVSNNIYFADSSSTQNIRINSYTDNTLFFDNFYGQYNFRTTNSYVSRLYISNGGNVGIGTTSPSSLLHVKNTTYGAALAQFETSGRPLTIAAQANYVYIGYGNREQFKIAATSGAGRFILGSNLSDDGSNTLQVEGNSYFAGNVGIGTTSPAKTLDVVGNARLSTAYANVGLSTITYAQLQGLPFILSDTTLDNVVGQVVTGIGFGYGNEITAAIVATDRGGSAAQSLDFITGTSTTPAARMSIDSVGNVGIGTIDPLRKLHVVGNFAVNAGAGQYYGVYINGTGEGANPSITIGDWHNASANLSWDSTNRLLRIDAQYTTSGAPIVFSGNDAAIEYARFTATGNLGIGTTSPSAKLVVQGAAGNLYIDDLGAGYNYYDASNVHNFRNTAGISRLYINTATGNVGIGTTSPSTRLHTIVDFSVSTTDYVNGTTGSRLLLKTFASTGNTYSLIQAQDVGGTSNNALVLQPYGDNVGIGTTSPVSKLQVHGNIALSDGGVIGQGSIYGTTGNASYSTLRLYDSSTGATVLNNQSYDIQLHTAGTAKMTVKNGGNVGIGTTSPSNILHVYKTGAHSYSIFENTLYESGIRIKNNQADWTIFADDSSNNNIPTGSLGFWDNQDNAVRVVFDGSGNVGIGTAAPDQKLHVVGNAKVTGVFYTDYVQTLSGTSIDFRHQDASTIMRVDTANARVGIGTTSPAGKLDIRQAQSTTAFSYPFLKLYPSATTNVTGLTTITLGTSTVDTYGVSLSGWRHGTDGDPKFIIKMHYGTANGLDALTINSSGNVGIGTTSPTNKLDIRPTTSGGSDVIGTGAITVGSDNPYWTLRGTATSLQDLAFDRSYSGTWYEAMRIQRSTGNVGIGRTPIAAKLEVEGQIRVTGTSGYTFHAGGDTDGGMFSTGDGTINFRTNGSERIRITSSGNVGIGTTSPTAKMHLYDAAVDIITQSTIGAARNILKSSTAEWRLGTHAANNNNFWIYEPTLAQYVFNITPAGNVGIGTNSPGQKLHVVGDARIEGNLTINGTVTQIDTDTLTTEQWLVTNDGTGPAVVINQKGSQPVIDIQDDGTSVMYIEDGGNVGVGTTSPGYKLDVAGTISNNSEQNFIYSTYDDVGALFQRVGTFGAVIRIGRKGVSNSTTIDYPADGTFAVSTAGSERMRLDGTILQLTTAASNQGIIQLSNSSSYQIRGGGNYGYISLVAPILRFDANGSEAMRITSAGNVGIGTTSPSYKLTVSGTVNTSDVYTLTASADYTARYRTYSPGDGNWGLLTYASDPEYHMVITGASANSGFNRQFRVYDRPTGNSRFVVNFDGSGVGVGTSGPTQQLHVSGNIRVTGAYYDSNNSAGTSGQILKSTGTGTDWVTLSEITGVDGTGTANYIAKWSDTDTIANSQIQDNGTTVGIGVAPSSAKLTVSGSAQLGSRAIYVKSYASLDTTGVAVAGLSASTNGDSSLFEFTCNGGAGQYQRIVYACHNTTGNWNSRKVIDEGTNELDVVASASAATITFTFKARTTGQQFTPRVTVEVTGSRDASYL